MSFTTDYGLQENDGWQFGAQLTTEHVWDGFVIYALLQDKLRNQQRLQVPHNGSQSDRLTNAMKARNKEIILYGQPDSITHACDKCVRTFEKDGEIRKHLMCCPSELQ